MNGSFIKYKKHSRRNAQYGGGNTNIMDSGNTTDPKVKRNIELYYKLLNEGTNIKPEPNWTVIDQIFDKDVLVVSSDGKQIRGHEQQKQGMKQMFQLAPDVRIESVDIIFGSGDWIAVTSTMVGTFTGKVTMPGSPQPLEPTGRPFRMDSCLLIKWLNDKVVEFRSYWNQKEFEKQIGIDKCIFV